MKKETHAKAELDLLYKKTVTEQESVTVSN